MTGFSRDQLRDRLGYLEGTLGYDSSRGPRNAILVGDATLAALDRMKELERGGLGPQAAADQIAQELESPDNTGPQINPQMDRGQKEPPPTELIKALENHITSLEDRIKELREDKVALRERVRDLETLALPETSEGRRRMGRLAAFRYALLGR